MQIKRGTRQRRSGAWILVGIIAVAAVILGGCGINAIINKAKDAVNKHKHQLTNQIGDDVVVVSEPIDPRFIANKGDDTSQFQANPEPKFMAAPPMFQVITNDPHRDDSGF